MLRSLFIPRQFSLGIDLSHHPPVCVLLKKERGAISMVKVMRMLPTLTEIQKPCRVTLGIPQDQIITKRFLLPMEDLSDEQIFLQIQLTTKELFALPHESIAFDFFNLSRQEVMLFATRQEKLDERLAQVGKLRRRVQCIEPEIHALARFLLYCQDKNPIQRNLIINLTDNCLQCAILDGNQILFSKQERSIQQLKQMLVRYEGEMPAAIFLTGQASRSSFNEVTLCLSHPPRLLSSLHSHFSDESYSLAFGLALRDLC